MTQTSRLRDRYSNHIDSHKTSVEFHSLFRFRLQLFFFRSTPLSSVITFPIVDFLSMFKKKLFGFSPYSTDLSFEQKIALLPLFSLR